jgi:hypothetical protein
MSVRQLAVTVCVAPLPVVSVAVNVSHLPHVITSEVTETVRKRVAGRTPPPLVFPSPPQPEAITRLTNTGIHNFVRM